MFKESCITEQTQYFFDNEERSYAGVLDCGNCSRYVHSYWSDWLRTFLCVLPLCMCMYAFILCTWCAVKKKSFPLLSSRTSVHPCVYWSSGIGSEWCLFPWLSSVFQPDLWWALIRHRLPWSVRAQHCSRKHESALICFSSLSSWLRFRPIDTNVHTPLNFFTRTSFCVNLSCLDY